MKHLHFVGIGGARLSSLAKLYLDRGYQISGSDQQESSTIKGLQAKGIRVAVGHQAANIDGADQVVYTNAVGTENPEVLEAKRRGIPVIEGAELLGQLMAEVGKGIAIAGTHGKSTTTAMTALLLTEGGVDPTVLIGADLAAFNGNHRSGKSPFMLVEACEFKRSFLELRPTYEVITNVDWDHPDCFPSLDDVKQAFSEFIALLPDNGTLVIWGDDPNCVAVSQKFPGKIVRFGYQSGFDWSVDMIRPNAPLGIAARLLRNGQPAGDLTLQVPGRHNLQNALGAIAIAAELGVDPSVSLRVLPKFTGVRRRFEIKGECRGAMVVDDYAHHPNAIRTTLATAKDVHPGRVWCVFQPHLYSRTKFLLDEFAHSFQHADILVLADIYPAREKDPGDISSEILAQRTRPNHEDIRYLGGFDAIQRHLRAEIRPGDLVITMGAGDIWKVGEWLLREEKA